MARRDKRSKKRIPQTTYTDKTNVRNIVLNQIYRGNIKEFLNDIFDSMNVTMYHGELGYATCYKTIEFDLQGWKSEEDFQLRLKHSKAYMGKAR